MKRFASTVKVFAGGVFPGYSGLISTLAVLAFAATLRADDYGEIAGAVASPLVSKFDDIEKAYTDGQVMLRVELARQCLQSATSVVPELSGPRKQILSDLDSCHWSMEEIRRLDAKVPDFEEIARKALNASPALVRADPKTGELRKDDRQAVDELAGTVILESLKSIADAWNASQERDNYRNHYRHARTEALLLVEVAKKRCTGKRRNVLRAKLKSIATDKLRPNNALDASTMHAFLDLEPWNPKPKKDALLRLADCFRRSRGMSTYPLKRFTDTVLGLSDSIESLPGYDELFETMRIVLAERDGEIAEAELLLQRGTQHLTAGRAADALKVLGQARIKAGKEEVLETCVRAANLAANAYLRLGLPWAARMELLTAARLSCQIVEDAFQSAFHGFHATRLLAWIELSQGRFAPFLRWLTIASECYRQLVGAGFDVSRFNDAQHTLESSLCDWLILLTRATARKLEPIANALHNFGFPMARFFLLYAAGRASGIENDFTHLFQEDGAWMHNFFRQWKDQTAARATSFKPIVGWEGKRATFTTQISGVTFAIETTPIFGAIAFSENLLGVIESMLALANLNNDAFVVDEVKIHVDIKDDGTSPPLPVVQMLNGTRAVTLIWKAGVPDWVASTDGSEVVQYLLDLCHLILDHATIYSGDSLKAKLDEWHQAGTLDRALGTSPTIHAIDHLIGHDCYDLESCIRIASEPLISPKVSLPTGSSK